MADSPSTSPSTSSTVKQTFTSRLPLMTWLAIAVVFLVAVTIRNDSDGSTNGAASEPASAADSAEEAASGGADSDSDDASATDGDATSGGDSADGGSTSGSASGDESGAAADPDVDDGSDAASTDPDGEGSAAPPPSTVTATLPTTTVAGAPPTATTVAGAAPRPTTTVVTPPPTTIVVTAPPTTITVTLPPTTTTIAPPVTEGCAVLGTDEFGDIEIELTVVSRAAAVAQLEIEFELTDVEGEVFLPEFQIVEYVAPGEVLRLTVLTFEPIPPGNDLGTVNCTLSGVEAIDLFEDQFVAGPGDTCSVIGVDAIGDVQLDVTVQNPDVDPADLVFTYAVRDAQGVRVISDVGFADGLDPGASASQQIDTLVPPPAGVDPATMTCDIVGLDLF